MNRWNMSVEGLGSLVTELTENQMMRYLKSIKGFIKIIGRYPDYFEERDIIKNAKKEEPDENSQN
jgi:hypothetical protein